MNIGIIGAGFTGLSAGYRLIDAGHQVTIYERDSHPGGLAVGYKKGEWHWTLEKHYHHFFTNDSSILNLAKEVGFPVIFRRPKTSVFVKDEIIQLDSPVSLLNFSHLSFIDRARMGATLALMRFNPFWRIFEPFSTSGALPRLMGKRGYHLIWEPQMEGKFGKYKNDISLAWFWARVYKRTSSLAYPEGGFLKLAWDVSKKIEKMGGKVIYDAAVDEVGSEERAFIKSGGKKQEFDKIIVTLPSFPFLKIAPTLPQGYKKRLDRLKGIGAINLVLRLKKPFFSDETYWLSVCESRTPIMAIVEHTNFMDKKYYNNEHIVYVGKYADLNDEIFNVSDKDLLEIYNPFLEKINGKYREDMIGFDVFRAPFAQPIIPPNYSSIKPEFDTPLANIYLANIQQVYPWDRGTNYAVELGEEISKYITK